MRSLLLLNTANAAGCGACAIHYLLHVLFAGAINVAEMRCSAVGQRKRYLLFKTKAGDPRPPSFTSVR